MLRVASMVHKVNSLLENSQKNDNFLIICPKVNMLYGKGIPEGIWSKNPDLKQKSYSICI
jgi:hypothetical protein